MKIFSSSQILEIDHFTIEHEPIKSIDLMERASNVFVKWFIERFPSTDLSIAVICGPGNNGGDGLAIARLLQDRFYTIGVFVCEISVQKSDDFNINFDRLPLNKGLSVESISKESTLPDLDEYGVIIDGIFGSGLNRVVDGYWAELIQHINKSKITCLSIDIPSGLFADKHTPGISIAADEVLSFEFPKKAFLMPENRDSVKNWSHRSIGLHSEIINSKTTQNYLVDYLDISKILKPRRKFEHKGNFGHALFAGGSYGKMGAVILASLGCLRVGVGLLTCYIPRCGYDIVQTAVPEAMVKTSSHKDYLNEIDLEREYNSIGIGCGMGTAPECMDFIDSLFSKINQPVIIDADALNIISTKPDLLKTIPEGSILTPHPKEFSRLFGSSKNDFERNQLQREMASEYKFYILLKGAHSCLATPEGDCYFNSTGNAGMATAGSGDVLTGILTGILAQSYSSFETALLGMFIHGLSGDHAIESIDDHALIARDIVDHLPYSFASIKAVQ